MEYAAHQLKQRQDIDPIDVDTKVEDKDCPHEHTAMPPFRDIIRIIHNDNTLDLGGYLEKYTARSSLPRKDSYPSYVKQYQQHIKLLEYPLLTLHPSNEILYLSRRKYCCPVVLGACNGAY
jgi:hypothetical protein